MSTSIDKKISELLNNGASFSDIHIVSDSPMALRNKDGVIETPDPMFVVNKEDVLSFLVNFLRYESTIDSAWKKLCSSKNEFDDAVMIGGRRFRLNASLHSEAQKINITMRLLNEKITPLSELNFPSVVSKLALKPNGMVLVTGQTGSGKSTTLASMLDLVIKDGGRKIITLEDPIEYLFNSTPDTIVNQRAIGKDSLSWAKSIRASMRQDPDVILVGEMRDAETVAAALEAATTGHLVLSTLHTNSAASTVDRILGFFDGAEKKWAANMLSSVLLGVISQTLARKNHGGKQLVYEIMVATDTIRDAIRQEKPNAIPNLILQGAKYEMNTLNKCLAPLVRSGVITMESATAITYDYDDFLRELNG